MRTRPEDSDEIQLAPEENVNPEEVDTDEVSIDVSDEGEVSEDYKNYDDTLLSLTKLILIEKEDRKNKHENSYYQIIQQEAEGILNYSYLIPPSNSTKKTVKYIFDQLTEKPYCDKKIISKFIEKFKDCLGNSGSASPHNHNGLIDLVVKYDNAIGHLNKYLETNQRENSEEALAKTFNYYLDTQYKDAHSQKETKVILIGYGFGISLLGLGFPLLAASAQSGLGAMSPAICAGLGAISVMGSAATLVTTNRLARKERKNTYRKVSFEEPKTIEEVIKKIKKTSNFDIESSNQTDRSIIFTQPLNDEIEKLKQIITKQNTLKESITLFNENVPIKVGNDQSLLEEGSNSIISNESDHSVPGMGSTIQPPSINTHNILPAEQLPLDQDPTSASFISVAEGANASNADARGGDVALGDVALELAHLTSSLDSPRKIVPSRVAASLEVGTSLEAGASHGAISSAHSRTVTPEGSPAHSRAAVSLEAGASHGAISSAHSRTVTSEGSPTSSQRSSSREAFSRSVSPGPENLSEAGASHESELSTRRFPSNTPHQGLETPAPIGVLNHPQDRERSGSPRRS